MGNIEAVRKMAEARQETADTDVGGTWSGRTEIDAAHHALTIHFYLRLISEEGVRHVAEARALGHEQYCKTILRLEGCASGAAEQKIERRFRRSIASVAREPCLAV